MGPLENLGLNEPLTMAERFDYLWLTNTPFNEIKEAALALSTRWPFFDNKTAKHEQALFIFGDGSAIALHMKRSHLPIVFKRLATEATPPHKIKETKAAA